MSLHTIMRTARRRRSVLAALAVGAIGCGWAAQAGLKPRGDASASAGATFELAGAPFSGIAARSVRSTDAMGVTRERLSHGLPLDAAADFTVILHRGRVISDAPRTRADLNGLGPIGDLPVTLVGEARTVSARLGDVRVVSLTLSTGAGRKSCLGFVAPLPQTRDAGLTGWYCAALGSSAEEAALVHLLNHLRPRANGGLAAKGGHPLS